MTPLADITQSIDITAPAERVWTALTHEKNVEQWLGCFGYQARPGVVFYMQPDDRKRRKRNVEGATHCELLSLEPPERVAFSWFLPGTPRTLVEIIVTRTQGGSRVSLVHSGWDQFDPSAMRSLRDGLDGGWSGAVLPQLTRVAEAG